MLSDISSTTGGERDPTPAQDPGKGSQFLLLVTYQSNDAANATAGRLGRGVIAVVPVTSNVERVYPFQVLLPATETGLDRDSRAQAEQIRSVAVERGGGRLGVVPNSIMLEIDEALRLHLRL